MWVCRLASQAQPKFLSSPLSLLKFPNHAQTLAISLEKSWRSYLCHFAILKTDRAFFL